MADVLHDLIGPTKRLMGGGHRGVTNRLKTTIANGTGTSVELEFDVRAVKPGVVLSIEDELMYVWSCDNASKTATVQRGYLETTAVGHTAPLLVEVNPRWPQVEIRLALQNELRSWHPRLFAVVTKELSVASTKRAVDLDQVPDDFFHLLRVLREPRTGSDSWVRIRGRAEHNLNTADFPSGSALFLDDPFTTAGRIRFTYARKFATDDMSDAKNLKDDLLLADGQYDIARYGAAWRLVSGREIRRTDTEAQGEPRDAQEVPPGHIMQTARQLKALRDEGIREQAHLLRHRWGVHFG